jgi:hypothetical protein
MFEIAVWHRKAHETTTHHMFGWKSLSAALTVLVKGDGPSSSPNIVTQVQRWGRKSGQVGKILCVSARSRATYINLQHLFQKVLAPFHKSR